MHQAATLPLINKHREFPCNELCAASITIVPINAEGNVKHFFDRPLEKKNASWYFVIHKED